MAEIVGRTIKRQDRRGDEWVLTLDNDVVLVCLAIGHSVPPVSHPAPPATIKSIDDFKKGDRIKLKNVNPKKLNGATGTVVGFGTKRLVIQMDENWAWGPKWSGQKVYVPLSIVEKV